MCHSLLFGLLIGALATRLFFRMRYLRHFGGGCYGGRCGGRFGRFEGRFDGGRWRAGFPGAPFGVGQAGATGAAGAAGQAGAAAQAAGAAAQRPVAELVGGLELNPRQQVEVSTVLALLTEQVGDRGLQASAALRAVASEPFDRMGAEDALATVAPALRRELVDGLEHVHTILIPEQREVLRKALS